MTTRPHHQPESKDSLDELLEASGGDVNAFRHITKLLAQDLAEQEMPQFGKFVEAFKEHGPKGFKKDGVGHMS